MKIPSQIYGEFRIFICDICRKYSLHACFYISLIFSLTLARSHSDFCGQGRGQGKIGRKGISRLMKQKIPFLVRRHTDKPVDQWRLGNILL